MNRNKLPTLLLRRGALLFLLFLSPFTLRAESPPGEWISTADGIFRRTAKGMELKPHGNMHWILYNRGLSFPYTIEFEESIHPVRGSITFQWNYNLYEAATRKKVGTGFNQSITVNRWKILYIKNIFEQKPIPLPEGNSAKRKWKIVCKKNGSAIYLNGRRVMKGEADSGAIPSFAIQLHQTEGETFRIENLKIEDTGRGPKEKPTVFQYPLTPDGKRTFTVFAHDKLTGNQKRDLMRLPALFSSVEDAAGLPVTHTDPIIAIYETVSSGNNLGATPGYAGWLEIGPNMLESPHLIAHEFAHFYYCLGGDCGNGGKLPDGEADFMNAAKGMVADNWMAEGFASYLGMVGLNRLEEKPDIRYSDDLGNYFGKSDKIRKGGWYDGPLADGHRIKKKHVPPGESPSDVAFLQAYGKGYRFFYLLGSELGHKTIQQIIKKNRTEGTRNYGPRQFMQDLTKFSGKSAAPYFPGWVFPGSYETWSPADFQDRNENGIIDFAEKK